MKADGLPACLPVLVVVITQTGCSGRRDRIEFCGLQDFTDEQLRKGEREGDRP